MEKIKLKLRPEFLFVGAILLLALLLRLYKIDQFMTFLGDEGRDVRVIRDLLRGNLVFIGPMTSIGNMYLGPLYYYLVAPALFLSRLNPVGPAVEVALLSTLTVFLTWRFGREWFGRSAAAVAALLFALSPVAIIYSRSSWNPNPMPLFALLSVWGIWQVWQKKKYLYLSLCGLSLAAALQMHYLGLLLIPTLGLFWLTSLRSVWANRPQKRLLLRHTLIALGLFLLLMSPLALFDLKHNFMNFNAFKTFFGNRQTTVNFNPLRSDRFGTIISQVSQDFFLFQENFYPLTIGVILLLAASYFFIKNKKPASSLLAAWLFFGLLGLIVYKQHVYDHYYGFLYPAIYLFLGLLLSRLKLVGAALLLILVTLALIHSPLRQTPNNQLARTRQIVQLIVKESENKPFNFGLIAKQNYDESYRYFFENDHAPMVRGEDKVTDQLFVVCEDGDACQPEGNPAYQVAIFGPAHIVSVWEINGIKIYRLVHPSSLETGKK